MSDHDFEYLAHLSQRMADRGAYRPEFHLSGESSATVTVGCYVWSNTLDQLDYRDQIVVKLLTALESFVDQPVAEGVVTFNAPETNVINRIEAKR